MRAPSWLLAACLPLAACSATEEVAPAPFPVEVGGGFVASIEGDRLVVASADGRALLDGLPPAAVAAGGPPLVGFAVENVTTTYEMMFGTFMPEVTTGGPWRVAQQLAPAADGSLSILDGAGALLASITWSAPEAGHLIADVAPGPGPEHHFSWGFACDALDHFSGFGAQSVDVDHRGFTVPTWVEEHGIGKRDDDTYPPIWYVEGTRHASELPIPQYLSRRGYILTTETDLRSQFALCSESPAAARVEVDLPARIHLFDGPTPAQAIERATATFGRPRLPPPVAFAPWLDAIFGDANVRAVAQKLRAAGVPGSVIWTEDWRGGSWDGDNYVLDEEWQVDTTLYPDLKGTTAELHDEGFDFFVYFNSFVYESSQAWPETAPSGWLVQHADGTPYTFTGAKGTATGMLDLDNPAARAWAVGKMQAAIALGADGWMNDFGEWLPTDGVTAAGPSLGRHNAYPVLWQQTAREAIDTVGDGELRMFFGRSGWLGSAPLMDVMWAGRSAHRLRHQRRAALHPPHRHRPGHRRHLHLWIRHRRLPVGDHRRLHQGALLPLDRARRLVPGDAHPPRHPAPPGVELAIRRRHHRPLRPLRSPAHRARPLPPGPGPHREHDGLPHLARPDARLSGGRRRVGRQGRGPPRRFGPRRSRARRRRDQPLGVPARGALVSLGGRGRRGGRGAGDGAGRGDRDPGVRRGGRRGADVSGRGHDAGPRLRGGAGRELRGRRSGGVCLPRRGRLLHRGGGLAYGIAEQGDAAGALALTWNGQALGACDASGTAPCASATADGATASVTGPGELVVTAGGAAVATLTAIGGNAGRSLSWVVRR